MLIEITVEKIIKALPLITEEFVKSNEGACSYSAPCIIGLLLSNEELQYLREKDLDDSNALELRSIFRYSGNVSRRKIELLQNAFDSPVHHSALFYKSELLAAIGDDT